MRRGANPPYGGSAAPLASGRPLVPAPRRSPFTTSAQSPAPSNPPPGRRNVLRRRTTGGVTITQALLLALIQGVGELFPVSSLGHTILVPAILHWNRIDRADPGFLAFVVALHLGTALALVVFYRRDWIAIVGALVRSVVRGRIGDDPNEKIGWLLVVGTIPVGILGITFEHPVRLLFGSVAYAATFLVVNG